MSDAVEHITKSLKEKTFNSERLGEITLSVIASEFIFKKHDLESLKSYEIQIDFVINGEKESILEECANFDEKGLEIINQYYQNYTLDDVEHNVDCCINHFDLLADNGTK